MNTLNEPAMIQAIKDWLGKGSINIFGMQMSGKDTQGEVLAEKLNAALVAGGDILRSQNTSDRGKAAFKTGDLFHPEDYLAIILPYLEKAELADRPLILSSVGRMLGEEQVILDATQKSGHPTKAVIHLQISRATALQRMELADRGRDDDHVANLTRRIDRFEELTLPVIDIYRQKNLLIEIDGEQRPAVVTNDIITKLYERSGSA